MFRPGDNYAARGIKRFINLVVEVRPRNQVAIPPDRPTRILEQRDKRPYPLAIFGSVRDENVRHCDVELTCRCEGQQ